jgi:hypothetical protein
MSENTGNGIIRKLKQALDETGGMAEEIDFHSMSDKQRKVEVEKMTINRLLGECCAKCGQLFNEEGALKSIFVGQLQDDEAAFVDLGCFDKAAKQFPELKKIKSKPWREFSQKEKDIWRSAFSAVEQDSGYGGLFKKP